MTFFLFLQLDVKRTPSEPIRKQTGLIFILIFDTVLAHSELNSFLVAQLLLAQAFRKRTNSRSCERIRELKKRKTTSYFALFSIVLFIRSLHNSHRLWLGWANHLRNFKTKSCGTRVIFITGQLYRCDRPTKPPYRLPLLQACQLCVGSMNL